MIKLKKAYLVLLFIFLISISGMAIVGHIDSLIDQNFPKSEVFNEKN